MEQWENLSTVLEKQMRTLGDLCKGTKYDEIKVRFDQVFDDPLHNQFDFVLGLFCGTIVRGSDGKAVLADLTLNGNKHLV